VAAELVETTRLYGRGLAAIEPQWIPPMAGHLLKTQLLEPHWEKKAAEVVALERATLYGLVIYNNRRVTSAASTRRRARSSSARRWWRASGTFDAAALPGPQPQADRQVQELEHKARRQDVLVDDELIFAFYDQQLPAEVCSAATPRALVPRGGEAPAEAAACWRATS
jgi:ATP-dependent helicase HrpA